ncbi:MAG: AtpZ/AtpI family protein [Ignavibacteria bacterium]|nr:AtpZ/AtpI family protein [Ignavibacteria bacterium]
MPLNLKKILDKTSKLQSGRLGEAGQYLNLGIQMVLPILLCTFIGKWIDDKYATTPLWTIILAFFGIIVGMYTFFKTVLKKK